MKLEFNGKSREVTLHKVITAEIRGKAADMLSAMKGRDFGQEILEKMISILTNALEPSEMAEIDETNARTMFVDKMKEGKIKPEDWQEVMKIIADQNKSKDDPLVLKQNDEHTIRFFKAMIYKDGIEDEWLELIEQPINDTFWQTQDIIAMEDELSGFCLKARIGKFPLNGAVSV